MYNNTDVQYKYHRRCETYYGQKELTAMCMSVSFLKYTISAKSQCHGQECTFQLQYKIKLVIVKHQFTTEFISRDLSAGFSMLVKLLKICRTHICHTYHFSVPI